MTKQYWIGGFFIELSRNQITQNKQSQTMAPKALAVLTYLAENQGKVVSHDALLEKVWPDTVVSSNTLQRSIAQLRKALGDDGKVQSYIKTHAKQGYSLECDVRWHDLDITNSTESNSAIDCDSDSDTTNKQLTHRLRLVSIIIGIIVLGFLSFKYFATPQLSKFSFGEMRSLTATDNKEFGGIYSPDGQYIVFHRYSEDICINSNIWAKHIKTQQETQLTKSMGSYSTHSFSKDGKKLVFIESERCDKPITQKKCYKLLSLDFEKALDNPQSPSLLMECKNSRITKPTWLNNHNIAILQESSNRWKLISYSIEDNKSTLIYDDPQDGNLIDYDYSVKDDLIALTRIHKDGQNYIEILKPDGQLLSSHPIMYPPEIPSSRFIYPSFTPISQELIFSTGRQLFTLSYEGEITNISLPLDEPMGSPVFHPDGKRMLVIKGNWDSDIAMMPLSQLKKPQIVNSQIIQTQDEQTLSEGNNNDSKPISSILALSVLERSTLAEDNALYQPNGELIAFESDRSGEDQIWIFEANRHGNGDSNGSRQLTQFPIDTFIDGLDWAADGKSLLVNSNNTLTQVYLGSNQKPFPFSHRVEQLFQWNSEENTALLIVRINGILKFVELNLNNSEHRVINDKKVNWAHKSEDGRIIYTDHMDRFWQPGPAEDQLIEVLDSQGSDKRFIMKGNVIYGVNEEFQLWSYDLNEAVFNILGNTPKNVDLISDISQTDILLTIRITAKKEVAELSLSE